MYGRTPGKNSVKITGTASARELAKLAVDITLQQAVPQLLEQTGALPDPRTRSES